MSQFSGKMVARLVPEEGSKQSRIGISDEIPSSWPALVHGAAGDSAGFEAAKSVPALSLQWIEETLFITFVSVVMPR